MKREYTVPILAAAAVAVPGLIGAGLGVPSVIALILTIAAAAAVMLAFLRRYHRHTLARIDAQTSHLRGLIAQAGVAGGIPIHWSEHAITPETLSLVQHLIAGVPTPRVLELGSGVSTLLLAQSFRRRGAGHVLSLDDDERWAAQTSATIRREHLETFASIVHAPLVQSETAGRSSAWYDISMIAEDTQFDLVIVDGPPAWRGDPLARLPALYRLRRNLAHNGVLVLDDAGRGGEREIARLWQRDFPDLHFKMVDVGRGLFVASVQRGALDLLPSS